MTARDLIILPPGHEGAGFLLTRTERGIALHTGGFGNAHPSAVYELSDDNVAEIIDFLTEPAEPAEYTTVIYNQLPAWTRDDDIGGYVRKPEGKKPIAIALDPPLDGTYEVFRFDGPLRWPTASGGHHYPGE